VLAQPAVTTATMGMGERMRARFAALGGVELDIPPRTGNTPRYTTFED
jgi:hypothetical protein